MENIIEEDKKYLESQSLEDYDPVIEYIDYPITIKDKIYQEIENRINNKEIFHKYYSYTCWDRELKQFVCHTYAARTTASKGIEIKEVRRDFETLPSVYRDLYYNDWGCAKGCHVVWTKKKASYYVAALEPTKKWSVVPDYYFKKMAHFTYEMNSIENIIASDISLRYFGYKECTWEYTLLDYIKLYRKYPIVETFMKLGLYRFITNGKAIDYTSENKAFRKWLYKNYEECKGMAFQTVKNSFKKNPNGSVSDYYNSLMYRIQCGYELAAHDKEIYEYSLKYATQEKMYEYCTDNNIPTASYYDYLKACKWLRLDFNDTKVMFPKDFYQYHDEYIRQYAEWMREQQAEKAKTESLAVSTKMRITANKYIKFEHSNNDFMIIIAKNKIDLINEGSYLNHCVGRMSYDERQANEESLICFIRHIDKQEEPYVTLELGLKDLKVKQCYGDHDSKPSEDVMNYVNNIWINHVKKVAKNMELAY